MIGMEAFIVLWLFWLLRLRGSAFLLYRFFRAKKLAFKRLNGGRLCLRGFRLRMRRFRYLARLLRFHPRFLVCLRFFLCRRICVLARRETESALRFQLRGANPLNINLLRAGQISSFQNAFPVKIHFLCFGRLLARGLFQLPVEGNRLRLLRCFLRLRLRCRLQDLARLLLRFYFKRRIKHDIFIFGFGFFAIPDLRAAIRAEAVIGI